MQKLVWQNANGVELDLTSGNYGITEWEGFSNTSLNIQQQQVPFQDGGVFLDALIEQRELSVTLAMQDNNNLELRYQQRRELISALNPKLGEGYLIYTNDFISKRIKCVPQIPLFETHNSDTVGTPKASLSWTACSPYWEDLEETEVELPYGEDVTINNTGDLPVGIDVDITTDNVTDPTIENITTGRLLKLNGNFGGDIQIDTKFGQKKAIAKGVGYKWSSGGDLRAMAENKTTLVLAGDNLLWKNAGSSDITSQEDVIEGFFDDLIYDESQDVFFAVAKIATTGSITIKLYRSTDGKKWDLLYTDTIAIPTNLGFVPVGCIAEADTLYVGCYTNLYTSTNGVDWVKTENGFSSSVKKLQYIKSQNMLIAVTRNNILRKSVTSAYWTSLSYVVDTLTYMDKSTMFIAPTGDGTLYYSRVTGVWSSITDPYNLHNVYYAPSLQKVFANSDNKIYSSEDGLNWELETTIDGIKGFDYFYFSNIENKLYAIGKGCICTKSAEGQWETVRASAYSISVTCMGYIPETQKYYVGVGAGTPNLMYSENFEDWQIATVGSGSCLGVAYSPTLQLYCANVQSGIYTSPDLVNWTQRVNTGALGPYGHNNIIWCETLGKFFAGRGRDPQSYTGKGIYSSSDGINWTITDISTSNKTYGYSYIKWIEEKGIMLMSFSASYSGTTGSTHGVLKSTDGINWEEINMYVFPQNIAYGNGKIVLAGMGNFYSSSQTSSYILTSTDGINWESIEVASGRGMAFVEYSKTEETFYAIRVDPDNGGELYVSRDTQNWEKRKIGQCYKKGTTTFSNLLADETRRKIMIGGYNSNLFESYATDFENVINTISSNSDMNIKLGKGENVVRYSASYGGGNCIIKYRQKYIGV